MDLVYLNYKIIFKNSLPIALTYLVLGTSFGALFTSKGGTIYEVLFISIFCFAGAAQFIAIEFYHANFPILVMAFAIVSINIRHIFYGITLLGKWNGSEKIYLFSALTDENFTTVKFYEKFKINNRKWVEIFALNHLYWVVGCCLGCAIPVDFVRKINGVEIFLISFFVAILSNSVKAKRRSFGE